MLKTHAPAILLGMVFILCVFDRLHKSDMYKFRFDPLSSLFSNRWVVDVNAHRIGVDGRPKRIGMYMF